MPYSDSTPADVIQKRFGLSKSAFKRALGKLMKGRLVVQDGNWTRLAAAEGGAPDAEASPDAGSARAPE